MRRRNRASAPRGRCRDLQLPGEGWREPGEGGRGAAGSESARPARCALRAVPATAPPRSLFLSPPPPRAPPPRRPLDSRGPASGHLPPHPFHPPPAAAGGGCAAASGRAAPPSSSSSSRPVPGQPALPRGGGRPAGRGLAVPPAGAGLHHVRRRVWPPAPSCPLPHHEGRGRGAAPTPQTGRARAAPPPPLLPDPRVRRGGGGAGRLLRYGAAGPGPANGHPGGGGRRWGAEGLRGARPRRVRGLRGARRRTPGPEEAGGGSGGSPSRLPQEGSSRTPGTPGGARA